VDDDLVDNEKGTDNRTGITWKRETICTGNYKNWRQRPEKQG
jgi:hypothetical protein